MAILFDLTGKRFTRLLVVEKDGHRGKDVMWRCLCDCGKFCRVSSSYLRLDRQKSCGCWIKEHNGFQSFKGIGYLGKTYFSSVLRNARKRKKLATITLKYCNDLFEKQNGYCSLSGLPISFGKRRTRTASLDRIDSSRGYEVGNVQWVHKNINWMKQDFTQKEFVEYCCLVAKKHPQSSLTN